MAGPGIFIIWPMESPHRVTALEGRWPSALVNPDTWQDP